MDTVYTSSEHLIDTIRDNISFKSYKELSDSDWIENIMDSMRNRPTPIEYTFKDNMKKLGFRYEMAAQVFFKIGSNRYFADFFVPSLNIIFEIDGKESHTKPGDILHDDLRDEAFRSIGIETVRIPGAVVFSEQFKEIVEGRVHRILKTPQPKEGAKKAAVTPKARPGAKVTKASPYVLYRGIIKDARLTLCERIVLSYLTYRSLGKISQACQSQNVAGIDLSHLGGEYIPIWEETKDDIAKQLSMSRKAVYCAYANFRLYGFIKEDKLLVHRDIAEGYFPYYIDNDSNKVCSVIYSYLKCKGDKYGVIDTYHEKMGRDLGMSATQFSKNLGTLRKRHRIIVIPRGKRKYISVL